MQLAATLADVITEGAPLIASALADTHHPRSIRFAYGPNGIRATATSPLHLKAAFEPLRAAFGAAGWGFSTEHSTDMVLTAATFIPPWHLTQTGAPAPAFPPR